MYFLVSYVGIILFFYANLGARIIFLWDEELDNYKYVTFHISQRIAFLKW